MGKSIVLNRDWRFYLGDEPNADFMGYDDGAWREVNLPHDWSVEHPFDRHNASGTGYLPGGTAWYRKHFTLDNDVAGRRVRLTFNGVYKHARVWINSNYLGSRAYGYATFTYDITEFVRPGENVICVRVEHNEVADSRWFTGSGIYRDVILEISDPVSFETDGIFAVTESAGADAAVLNVAWQTAGADGVRFELTKDGVPCAGAEAKGACGSVKMTVSEPALWSPDSPSLYTLTGYAVKDGIETDEKAVTVGIRTIKFDADKGFFLNGVNMKLKGVCVHHDGGCLGAAVPKEVWARRLKVFKESGCNALRTAHNPPDPQLLDLCDELGLVVMDEAFDEWEGCKNKWWQGHNVYPPKRFGYAEDFPQWHEADLTGMVKRDRNHPSIVLWSIGNEIDYPNDPYVTPLFKEVLGNNDANKPAAERRYDVRKPDAGRLAVLAKELTELVHSVDTSRPVTSAMSFPELSTRTGYADALDASGYNYREYFYEEDHARFPGRVIYGSENSHSTEAWQAVIDHDYICGQFLWTGIDFLGECRGWPVRISQAGMVDMAGYPKALFWMRRAMWTDAPMVKVCCGGENIWDKQLGWTGTEGENITVYAFTNQKEAELFVNGKSCGKKEVKDWRAEWSVPYEAGKLTCVAGGVQDTLETTGSAVKLVLNPDIDRLPGDGRSVCQIEVSLLDDKGRVAFTDDHRLHVQLVGDGELLGIENGKPDDLTPYAEAYRNTYHGRAIVYVRSACKDLSVYFWTDNGLKKSITL